MNVTVPPETEVLRRGLQELRQRLPIRWKVSKSIGVWKGGRPFKDGPDAMVWIRDPDGKKVEFMVEVKSDGSPRTVVGAIGRLKGWLQNSEPMLIAPFLPARSRDMAEAAGVNYADLTGNVYVSFRRPALFLRDRGAEENPYRGKDPTRRLARGTAGRVVLWLCQLAPPFSSLLLTDVAKGSGVSLSYVSRLVDILEREDLVRRKPRGPIEAVDRPGLVRRWAEDYSLLGSNRWRLFLDPRGAENALEGMKSKVFQRMRFAVSGSFAARRYAPVTASSKLVCYVEDLDAAADVLSLAPAKGTGNVILLSPYDPIVLDEARHLEPDGTEFPIPYAPPAQVAVDCLTGPDRMPEEGAALLDWLQQNRPGWEGIPGRGGA